MKFNRYWLLILVFLILLGCAAHQLEPLATNHPAHPEAMAASARPASKTLAYARSDMPSSQPTMAMAAQQGGHGAQQPAQTGEQTAVGEGKVVATVPNANQLVVEHGEIKGFMGPMTMGYQVDPPALLKELKAGDKVRFVIDVQKKTIVKIEKMK
jgi:Cu(I)/Ag(I) efflux system protein CusF